MYFRAVFCLCPITTICPHSLRYCSAPCLAETPPKKLIPCAYFHIACPKTRQHVCLPRRARARFWPRPPRTRSDQPNKNNTPLSLLSRLVVSRHLCFCASPPTHPSSSPSPFTKPHTQTHNNKRQKKTCGRGPPAGPPSPPRRKSPHRPSSLGHPPSFALCRCCVARMPDETPKNSASAAERQRESCVRGYRCVRSRVRRLQRVLLVFGL